MTTQTIGAETAAKTVTENEAEQIARANATGLVPAARSATRA